MSASIAAHPSPETEQTSIPALASAFPTAAETAAETYLRSLLHRVLRLTLKDSRTLLGRLYVIDGGGNIVLSDTEEFPPPPPHLLPPLCDRPLTMEEEQAKEGWERWEAYKPRSEPFGGPGTGWGGRGLGLVLVKLADCTKVELMDEDEPERIEGARGT